MSNNRSPSFRCLFCNAGSTFTRAEHPIPESLGNDDTVLPPGFVCDQCNQYFGSKLERMVLASPPFCVERVGAAIRTKKGKYAKHSSSELTIHSTGYWDRVVLATRPGPKAPIFVSGDRGMLLIPPPRDHRSMMARFMLKMGLELLLMAPPEDPYSSCFDPARRCARFGDGQSKWEVAYGRYPRRADLLVSSRTDEMGPLETRQVYEYSIGGMTNGDRILWFAFVDHCFACNLSKPGLRDYIVGFNAQNEFKMELMP